MKREFPEDHLTLLAPSIHSQTPESFFAHVQSRYEPRTATGKAYVVLPKGKFLKKPTKDLGKKTKRPSGTFEIRYQSALGLVTESFSYPRSLQLESEFVIGLAKKLRCDISLVEDFLKKKKFVLENPPV